MRILFLVDNFDGDDRHGLILLRLCERLVPIRELTLMVCALGKDGRLNARFKSLGIHTKALGSQGLRDRKALKAEAKRMLFRADRPDIIHSVGHWPDLEARAFSAVRDDIPMVTSVFDMGFCSKPATRDNFFWRLGEKFSRKNVQKVIACSSCQAMELTKRGVPESLIDQIPLGIDGVQSYPVSDQTRVQFRKLIGVSNDAPLIVCSQRLRSGHGLETLLKAMPTIIAKYPTVMLFLVGEGPLRETLDEQIKNSGIQEHVRIIGTLTSALSRLYSTADVAVYTATHEAFSIPVAECQASGTPVVAARGGGNGELIVDKETGLLFEPENVHALADAVILLIENQDLARDMGAIGRDHVLENYEISKTADAYVQLWRETASEALWETTTSMHFDDLQEMKREAASK